MADTSIFSRLQKLFSTQVVVRRIGKNKVRTIDTNRLQSAGSKNQSSQFDRYGRLHGSNSIRNWQTYNERYNYLANKLELYSDYEAMDRDSIIASILDVYSDECTLENDMGEILRIKSSNNEIKKTLHNLFYDILNIDFNLWSWIRGMNKYGDYYLYLNIDEELGILNVQPLSVYETIREEGYDPENPQSVRFQIQQANTSPIYTNREKYLESYQVAHFRLLTDSNFLPYGRSLIEPARKVWKQLTLMEDAMMIHRIMRAPEKRVFKIDIGNIPPNEVDSHMQTIIQQMKKVPYVDENTGDYNLKFNLQNMLEDYYLPVRGGQTGTEIDTLSGMEFGGIDDIEYLRNRMLAALKVPKAFIGYEEGLEGKSTLAQQDIRFARSIERIQKIVVSELTKIAIIHLYTQGYQDADLIDFELSLTGPSIIYEKEKLELWQEKIRLASDIDSLKMLSQEWVYKHVFNLSDDEWKTEQFKVINDLKLKFRQEQISSEGNDPVVTGESFGTPHDLATIHTTPSENEPSEQTEIPEGGWPGAGRPKEGSNYRTDNSTFGRDPLGDNIGKLSDLSTTHKYKGGSPLSLENISMIKKMPKIKSKKIITESLKNIDTTDGIRMLDETNILDY
jgi:hypothetical protein